MLWVLQTYFRLFTSDKDRNSESSQMTSTKVRNWDTFKDLSKVTLKPGSNRGCAWGRPAMFLWARTCPWLDVSSARTRISSALLEQCYISHVFLLSIPGNSNKGHKKKNVLFFTHPDSSNSRNFIVMSTSGPVFSVIAWKVCHGFRWLHS